MKKFDVQDLLYQMTLEEKAQMCSGSDFWRTQDIERLGIPSVMMCDGPNGLRKQAGIGDHMGINDSIETVCYPTSSAMASSFDTDLLRELGEILGQECQAEQVAMLLGPGINMKRSPLCGRNFEYFSEEPYLAGKLAAAYIQGVQNQGVAACVKHFAANNQETRRLSGSSQIEERAFREIYLPAFETAVKEGQARSIMCAYNAINGVFCAENKELLTDILRKEWGFDGFVVTDWGAIKDRVQGLKAGVDLEMPGSTTGKTERILKAIEDGSLEEKTLDQAVCNILTFIKEALNNQKDDVIFDRETAREKSEKFAKESAVLLKNESILPLDKTGKLAFIGAFAEKPRYQGAGSSHINEKHPITAMECVYSLDVTYAKGYDPKSEEVDEKLLKEAVELARAADVAVIFAGLPEAFEIEGCDREDMAMPYNQNVLIEKIAKIQKNTVVLLHGGAPMELPWYEKVAGILLLHLGGSAVGKAELELLFGTVNPSGKLAETWPLKVEDNPSYLNFPGEYGVVNYRENIFIGYRYYDKKKMQVRFPFGYGLSYTSFTYSDIRLSSDKIKKGETLKISCRIRNTGKVFGKEIVQLYVAGTKSNVIRPVKELKKFKKIALMPDEEKEVVFELDQRIFSYYEEKVHKWFVERGTYEIIIGASSRDLRLQASIQVESEDEIPITITRNSTIGDLITTSKGQAILPELMKKAKFIEEMQEQESSQKLGEGTERMMQAMMMEMSLGALCSYGKITEEEMDELLERLK